MNLSQDIHSLTDFKRKTTEFMTQMKQTKRPVVLTVNGKAALVVQDAESYQEMLDQLDRLEFIEAVRVGLAAEEAGESMPLEEAFAELYKEFDISD